MISCFEIKNFSCIRHLVLKADFAEGKAPNGYLDMPLMPFVQVGEKKAHRVCPVLAVYGANASGKTTVLRAMKVLQGLIVKGWKLSYYQPNLLAKNTQTESSQFSLTFWKMGTCYNYKIEISNKGILKECLKVVNTQTVVFCVQNAVIQQWNGRELTLSEESIKNSFQNRCIHAVTGMQIKSFLNEIATSLPGINSHLILAWEYILQDVLFCQGDIPFDVGLQRLAQTFDGNQEEKDQLAEREMLSYLRQLDINIVSLKINKKPLSNLFQDLPDNHPLKGNLELLSDEQYSEMKTAHRDELGNLVWFDLSMESEGTRRIIGLLGFLLAAIREGKTVFIDEIDQSIHSLLVIELIKLFKEKRINSSKAQLIFTIHNTDLLAAKLLGLSEVAIVSHLGFKGSYIMRLSDVSGLRNVDDFRRRYLRGDFGGIPFPYV